MITPDYTFKFVLVGSVGVGKSCLKSRFINYKFTNDHTMTIGSEFDIKVFNVGDVSIKAQVWDTSGQSTLRSLTRTYFKGTTGFLIVYDVSDRDTFNMVPEWLQEVRKYSPTSVAILIGNKTDQRREVESAEGLKFAEEHDLLFAETSAKTSSNVSEAFEMLAVRILEDISTGSYNLGKTDEHGIKVGGSCRDLHPPRQADSKNLWKRIWGLLSCDVCKNHMNSETQLEITNANVN